MISSLGRSRVGSMVGALVVAVLIALNLFGLYFLIVTSMKSRFEYASNYFLPPLQGIEWSNFAKVLPIVAPSSWNSVMLAFWTVLVLLVVVTPATYVFTWHKFPGKEKLYSLAIVTIMIPSVLTFVPQFVLVNQLGLLDSQPAFVLPIVASSIGLGLFLLRAFFRALPVELIEAARIDGASEMGILIRVVIPLTVPALVTISVLTISSVWNSYLWPLLTLPSQQNWPAAVAVTFFSSDPIIGGSFPLLMAAYLVSSLPLIVILGSLLRYFMAGATQGGVKF